MLYKIISNIKWELKNWKKNVIFITILPITFLSHIIFNIITFYNILYYIKEILKNINNIKIIKIYQNEILKKKIKEIDSTYLTFLYMVLVERTNKKAFEMVYNFIKNYNKKDNTRKIITIYYFLKSRMFTMLFGYSWHLLNNNDIISYSIMMKLQTKLRYKNWEKMNILEKTNTKINEIMFDIFLKLNNTTNIKYLKKYRIIIIKKKIKTNPKESISKWIVNKGIETFVSKERMQIAQQIFNELKHKNLLEESINLTRKNTENTMLNKNKEKPHLHKYIENHQTNEILGKGCTTKPPIIVNNTPKILTEKDIGSLKENTVEYRTPIHIRQLNETEINKITSEYYNINEDQIDRGLSVDFLNDSEKIILTHIDKNQFTTNKSKTLGEKLNEWNNEKLITAIKSKNEFFNINNTYIENLKKEGIIKDKKEIEFLMKVDSKTNIVNQQQQINFFLKDNNIFDFFE